MKAHVGLTSLALLLATACVAAPASANPPRPVDLRVAGPGEWQADNRFTITWTNPATGGSLPVATHYRLRDPQGAELEEKRLPWLSDGLAGLTLPKVPGTYSAEVWLEDAGGAQGPAAGVQLGFDDVRPAATVPEPIAGWIGRASFPLRIRMSHPAGPRPISGIRGYAIAIGTAPAASPCSRPDRCSDTETTLRGGSEDDEVQIGALPEGTNYLHAVAVSGSGMKSPSSGRTTLRVDIADPVTRLEGAPAGWTNRTVRLVASAEDRRSGMGPDGEGPPPLTAIRVGGAPPAIGLGDSVTATVIDEGLHRVAYYARDAAGNVDDGGGSNGHTNSEPRTALVRIDRTSPALAFVNSQQSSDPELLRARIADRLAGPDPSRGQIGVRLAGSGDGFEPLATAPGPSGELRAHWDSDAYPAGTYEFRATGYDAAGNAAVTMRRRNGEPMLLSNPLKATTALRAVFTRRGLQRTVPYGRRVLLSGRLIAGRSTPLRGREVRVVERFADGAEPATRVSTLTTDPAGGFSFRTAPGPSRTIAVVFNGSPTLGRSASTSLDLRVRSRVRMRASAAVAKIGGPPLVFSGELAALDETAPSAARSVQLQFRLPGLPWSEFRTIETDRRGRFRYAYRFSDDDSRGARFQFRAYAPAQENWPFEPAGSRPTLVRGR